MYCDNDKLLNGLCEENVKHSAWNKAFGFVCQAAACCGWHELIIPSDNILARIVLHFIPGRFWTNTSHSIGFIVPHNTDQHSTLLLRALFKAAMRNLAKDLDVPITALVKTIIFSQIYKDGRNEAAR